MSDHFQQHPSPQPPYGPQHGPYAGNRMKNALGVWALVLGILTIVFSWAPFLGFGSYITGVVGVVLGIYGIRRFRYGAATNQGVSIAGITTSGIGLASVVLATVVYSAVLYAAGNEAAQTDASPDPTAVVATDEPASEPSSKPTTDEPSEPAPEPTTSKPDKNRNVVIFRVWGEGHPSITYSSDSSNHSGSGNLPFKKKVKLDESALYYAITAQLQGGGDIKCSVEVNGVKEKGSASGGYNICTAQVNGGLTGWN